MRRVIRKRIRRVGDGFDLAVDLNADVAINLGNSRTREAADVDVPEEARPGSEDPGDAPDNEPEGRER